MKKKKIIIIGIVVLVIVGLVLFVLLRGNKYKLKLPEREKIVSVSLERNGSGVLISSEERLEKIFDVLYKMSKSNKESTTEKPEDKDYYKMDLNYEDSVATTIYLYKEGNAYYIEQPLNGIYEMKSNDYDIITSYLG